MAEDNMNHELNLIKKEVFDELRKQGSFDISPCTNITNIDDNPKYKKLELTSGQKMQMSSIVNNLPKIVTAYNMANTASAVANYDLYAMILPKDLSRLVMQFNNGSGYGNTLFNLDGKFATQAPLQKYDLATVARTQAMILTTFTAVSIVTQQYFLAQINSELDCIKLDMDKILEFLYGDKKAELMAEVTFAKYAFVNYAAIMAQESQRIATIAGLQQARKVAMKDCEFYISDLEATINNRHDISSTVEKAFKIEESLNLALQLCVMSSILEVHYSQNFDPDYLKYIEDDICLYIDKCEKLVLGNFNKLQVLIAQANPGVWKKIDKGHLQASVFHVVERFQSGGDSELTKALRSGLHISDNNTTYYISKDGNVYIKSA